MTKAGNTTDRNIRLKQIINDKRLRNEFRKFLQKEFSEENLDFCVEVEKFCKTQKGKKQVVMGHNIVNTYIAKNAENAINLDAAIISDIRFRSKFDFDHTLFNEAYRHVKLYLEFGAVKRFLHTVCTDKNGLSIKSPLKMCLSPKLKR